VKKVAGTYKYYVPKKYKSSFCTLNGLYKCEFSIPGRMLKKRCEMPLNGGLGGVPQLLKSPNLEELRGLNETL
jgi:hypothetical protein